MLIWYTTAYTYQPWVTCPRPFNCVKIDPAFDFVTSSIDTAPPSESRTPIDHDVYVTAYTSPLHLLNQQGDFYVCMESSCLIRGITLGIFTHFPTETSNLDSGLLLRL